MEAIDVLASCIDEICDELGIGCPNIIYDQEIFESSMQNARTTGSGASTAIRVRTVTEDNLTDVTFDVACELRKIWQKLFRRNELNLDNVKKKDRFDNDDDYMLQPAIVDANAYATIFVSSAIGLDARVYEYSDVVMRAINKRIKEIIKERGI